MGSLFFFTRSQNLHCILTNLNRLGIKIKSMIKLNCTIQMINICCGATTFPKRTPPGGETTSTKRLHSKRVYRRTSVFVEHLLVTLSYG